MNRRLQSAPTQAQEPHGHGHIAGSTPNLLTEREAAERCRYYWFLYWWFNCGKDAGGGGGSGAGN